MHTDKRGFTYRSYRSGGTVRREYLGRGAGAELAAMLDSHERAEREAEKRQQRAEREALDGQEKELKEFYDAVTAIARAVLESHGYHQHARGAWRKRRETMPKTAIKATTKTEPVVFHASSELNSELLTRVQNGDAAAAAQLSKLLKKPENAQTRHNIAAVYNTSETAIDAIAERIAGKNLLVAEAIKCYIEDTSREIAGPCPSPLERLLAERVIVCKVRLDDYEQRFASRAAAGGLSQDDGELFEQRIDRAQKRYLAAIKALATVRKLQLPTVQVNIGEKQINVANG